MSGRNATSVDFIPRDSLCFCRLLNSLGGETLQRNSYSITAVILSLIHMHGPFLNAVLIVY